MSFNPTNPAHIRRRAEEPLTQLRAATTLLQLIQEDAPAAEWSLDHRGRTLSGHLMTRGATDTELRQGLAAWQRIIGAGPVSTARHAGTDHISIEGSYEGVPVRVVTIVDAQTEVEKRLAAAVEALDGGEGLSASALRALLGGGEAA